jgi:hypothetical protein
MTKKLTKKEKQFIVTERELIVNIQPMTSMEVAHLFYGVPKWAKKVRRDISTGNYIFTE